LELRAAGGGRVIALADGFEDGGVVTAGQVLVRLDPADAQSAVDRAQSDVEDARAEGRDANRSLVLARDELNAAQNQADLRERAFERQQDLADRGVGTATATETAELAVSAARQSVLSRRLAAAQAEARVDQAATRLARAEIARAEAQRRLDDTTLTAPFDGTLSATDVVVGRLVSANERLAELIDPDDLELSFRLSTAQYARLLDGNGALIKADVIATLDVAGVDLRANGTITRASAAAGAGATGRLIFATLTEAAGFKPGDFVTVSVQEPALDNVVRLPSSAVDAGGEVLVLGPENRLEALSVTNFAQAGRLCAGTGSYSGPRSC
jgi:membrane fusion protein (multidrug efflux system)